MGLTGNALYVSSKIAFGFNYIDATLDITHDNDQQGDHGTHVAGIATANRYVENADGTYTYADQRRRRRCARCAGRRYEGVRQERRRLCR